jgi:hypothetical protein
MLLYGFLTVLLLLVAVVVAAVAIRKKNEFLLYTSVDAIFELVGDFLWLLVISSFSRD